MAQSTGEMCGTGDGEVGNRRVRGRANRATAAALAAVLIVPTAAACASRHTPVTTPVAETSSPQPERLTPDVAAKAFRSFINNDDVARASGDERLALALSSDGQSLLTAAAYQKSAWTGDPLPRYQYGTPAIYTPRLSNYPQWFVVSVDRTPVGTSDSAKQSVLLGFILKSPAERWRLSVETQLAKGVKPPAVQVDKDGYATPLPTFDSDVLIEPRQMSAIQASLVQDGPLSEASKAMKPGPYTTDYYTQSQKDAKAAADAGQALDSVIFATSYPIFPLRTADGGALVLYALSRTTITYLKKKGGSLPIPRQAAHLLFDQHSPGSLLIKDQLNITETLQFAGLDPIKVKAPAVQPKADVIASDGDATSASTQQQAG